MDVKRIEVFVSYDFVLGYKFVENYNSNFSIEQYEEYFISKAHKWNINAPTTRV